MKGKHYKITLFPNAVLPHTEDVSQSNYNKLL